MALLQYLTDEEKQEITKIRTKLVKAKYPRRVKYYGRLLHNTIAEAEKRVMSSINERPQEKLKARPVFAKEVKQFRSEVTGPQM